MVPWRLETKQTGIVQKRMQCMQPFHAHLGKRIDHQGTLGCSIPSRKNLVHGNLLDFRICAPKQTYNKTLKQVDRFPKKLRQLISNGETKKEKIKHKTLSDCHAFPQQKQIDKTLSGCRAFPQQTR
jgi:hypothetical protein